MNSSFEDTQRANPPEMPPYAGVNASCGQAFSQPVAPKRESWLGRFFQMLGCLALVVILFVLALAGGLVYLGFKAIESSESWTAPGLGKELYEQKVVRYADPGRNDGKKIVLLDVKGVISNSGHGIDIAKASELCEALKEIRQSPDAVAVILDMDTPGGEIVATDEIYGELQKCRQAGIKLLTCMHSMGASGGYYLACGTDWIVANRMTMTGSIGVIMSSVNISKMAEKIGVESVVIKSGKMKDMLSPMRPMGEEERKYLEDSVRESYLQFAAVVAAGRSVFQDAKAVTEAEFTDGRVISGALAKEYGLVDQLGGMDEAIAKAEEMANCQGAEVVRYFKKYQWMEDLMGLKAPGQLLNQALKPVRQDGCLYFLPPHAMGVR